MRDNAPVIALIESGRQGCGGEHDCVTSWLPLLDMPALVCRMKGAHGETFTKMQNSSKSCPSVLNIVLLETLVFF